MARSSQSRWTPFILPLFLELAVTAAFLVTQRKCYSCGGALEGG